MIAAYKGHLKVCQLLVDKGASLDIQSKVSYADDGACYVSMLFLCC